MYEYELQQIRSAELIRRAEHERLVRDVIRSGRAARREAAERAAGNEADTRRPRRNRSPRTA
ncbi:hypothetical protein K4749_18425 [Streptomyces sp. TRM72054]|uniref:hypothetical protein n=1 Tax=Streptomyces sp. TRM72054 TaxID=2870562 RepID=UPI001C8B192C|nr:hypothetical protein [Streptomyces sp. TRM72054]MBX9395517.1 hypothetical protein [Streptomyces sp. TRM72054]